MQDDTVELGFNKRVGARLREFRKEKGWSQRQLAAALQGDLKLDPSAITRIERGERSVKLREASAIADALGISLYYLVAPDGQEDPRLAELFHMTDVAREAIEGVQTGFSRAAMMYSLAIAAIEDSPGGMLGGLDSKTFLADEAKEIILETSIVRIHMDVEHYALLEEMITAAVRSAIVRVDPGDSDT